MRALLHRFALRTATLAAATLVGACAMTDSSMTGAPSYNPGSATPPALSGSANELSIGTWQWLRTDSATGTSVQAAAPERYTLTFDGGGRLLVRADCNRGSGSYQVSGGTMKIMPIALTRMGCPPDSQDSAFVQPLDRVTSYSISGTELSLRLSDGGTMRLRGIR